MKNLVQITFYEDYGQKSFKVVNDVVPNSIHMSYKRDLYGNRKKYIAFDYVVGNHKYHTWVDLAEDTTFGIYTNNLEV